MVEQIRDAAMGAAVAAPAAAAPQVPQRMPLTFITPTWAGDIERFALLRESMQLFAPGFEHLVVVQTEDVAPFRERFGRQGGLQLLTTAEVLPAAIEHARVRRASSGLSRRWQRLRHGPPWDGWRAQQLTKIFALHGCAADGMAAFIDSDVFVCGPLAVEDFTQRGLLKLYRRAAPEAESLAFAIAAHDMLGHRLEQVTQLHDHIFQPACFRVSTARCLVDTMQQRFGAQWVDRLRTHSRPSEYNLLGEAALLQQDEGYAVIDCAPSDVHHSIRYEADAQRLEQETQAAEAGDRKFFLMQSNLDMPTATMQETARRVMKTRYARMGAGAVRPPL